MPRFCAFLPLLALALFVSATSAAEAPKKRPNIIIILTDDMGYSDIGCYGGEIPTPNLDTLAKGGVRFTQFYNTARCCPTRASLLTGLYPHQAGIGHMNGDSGRDGYRGELNNRCVTIAEALKPAGYRNYMVGKWHVARNMRADGPKHDWPIQRGFDRYYGTIAGAGNYFDPACLTRDNAQFTRYTDPEYRPEKYYYTDALADNASRYIADHKRAHAEQPFFLYVAFTAAHWPLHAPEEDIAKQQGKYDGGYDAIRQARYTRMKSMGLLLPGTELTPTVGDWGSISNKAWEARCMEVYAAQVARMDAGVGRIVSELKQQGVYDNTLIFYLQDNGGCAENINRNKNETRAAKASLPAVSTNELLYAVQHTRTRDGWPVVNGPNVMPGPADTYLSYGKNWANVSTTPFREYKHWVHEGGISTPLIAHWPAGIAAPGGLRREPGHLIDLMATCVDVAGATYPKEFKGQPITPLEGVSLRPAMQGEGTQRPQPIFWEHEGNRAVRDGHWKLVAKGPAGKWELYDMGRDRSETRNLASAEPEQVKTMVAQWEAYANRANVLPWIWKRAYNSQGAGDDAGGDTPEMEETTARKLRFELKAGDELNKAAGPQIGGKAFSVTADIAEVAKDGVIVAQGGSAEGFVLYIKEGKPGFALRRAGKLTKVEAAAATAEKTLKLAAEVSASGELSLSVNGTPVGKAQAGGLLTKQPQDGLQVGRDENGTVGDYESPFTFEGKISGVVVEIRK